MRTVVADRSEPRLRLQIQPNGAICSARSVIYRLFERCVARASRVRAFNSFKPEIRPRMLRRGQDRAGRDLRAN